MDQNVGERSPSWDLGTSGAQSPIEHALMLYIPIQSPMCRYGSSISVVGKQLQVSCVTGRREVSVALHGEEHEQRREHREL